MNYYERNLGNYAKKTMHLSQGEHGAYNLLMDHYYANEGGIPEEKVYRVARARSRDEIAATDTVLKEFFVLENGLWTHKRCDEEIAKVAIKRRTSQENGKKGGRPKNNPEETQEKPIGFFPGSESESKQKAHQTSDISIPLSDDNGQAEPVATSKAIDPAKLVYDTGKDLLHRYGCPKSKSGGLITAWLKHCNPAEMLEIIAHAGEQERKDIVAYITGCVKERHHGERAASEAAAERSAERIAGVVARLRGGSGGADSDGNAGPLLATVQSGR